MPKLTEEDVKNRFITPSLEQSGWKKSEMWMEHYFTDGKVIVGKKNVRRGEQKKADYLLEHHSNFPIAIVEAKSDEYSVHSGIQQAIDYAKILDIPFAYSSNGTGFVEHDLLTGKETSFSLEKFPTKEELWERYTTYHKMSETVQTQISQPYYVGDHCNIPRYYQRIAINRTIEAVAREEKRLMLVMATGTGKTFTAFQIIHRLYSSGKVKKVLYLADRNILIDQTLLNDFAPFSNKQIINKVQGKKLDSAYDIFMSLYQQLSGEDEEEAFLQFKPDFFDLIVIDECHRGSASENSNWRKILDHFQSAIHIGMTATPKEEGDVHNSNYFGEALYTYSLKQGINDGFLAPYRVLRVGIDLDLNGYEPEDGKTDIYGQDISGKIYGSKDYDRNIIIDDRTLKVAKRISDFLKKTDRYSKTIVFCVDEDHAGRMRQALVNENTDLCKVDPRYVMRITGTDKVGKAQLESFIQNDTKYPTIVTTVDLLATGVDCKMCKVIALDTTISSMTKFKQIIGRGTRLVWDRDKKYFTILDFRKVTTKFSDPTFDGPPSSTTDVPSGTDFPDEPDDTDDGEGGEGPPDPILKARVTDVMAKIISEVELIYSEDGKLIANRADSFRTLILKKYPKEEDFVKAWSNESKSKINDDFQNLGIDFDLLYDHIGQDVDLYDVILMVAYQKDAVLKIERAENFHHSSFYREKSTEVKAILDEMVHIYLKNDVFALEDRDLIKLDNFRKFGGPVKVLRAIGKADYENTIQEIIKEIYR